MVWLVLGLLLWSVVHLSPSVAPQLKEKSLASMGENGYKGVFSLLLLGALGLIIYGWRSTTPDYIYHLTGLPPLLALALSAASIVLFGASNYPSRIKQYVRNPQLTGVLCWSVGHLLLNGDSRSLVLFGGMAIWSVLEIKFINRRDGAWVKPEVPTWGQEIKGLAICLVVLAVVVAVHPWLSGVSVL